MVEAREAGSFREGDRGQGDLRRYDRGRRGGRALRGGGTTAEDQKTRPLRGVNSGGGAGAVAALGPISGYKCYFRSPLVVSLIRTPPPDGWKAHRILGPPAHWDTCPLQAGFLVPRVPEQRARAGRQVSALTTW